MRSSTPLGPTLERASGILLHLSSLPGRHGHGDLGREARQFVDFLALAKQRYWQMLPIHPVGAGDSPYSGVSAFAGNPLFISIDSLVDEGLLSQAEVGRPLPASKLDYTRARAHRLPLLHRAFGHYQQKARGYQRELAQLRERARFWLPDYCLFMALRTRYGEQSWLNWEEGLRTRKRAALEKARRELADQVAYYEFEQLMFDRQWRALRAYAAERQIKLIGDIPIFVSQDSADVWANQASFLLDAKGRPTHVSGVPPDYFSADGQLWGTPLYDWRALKQSHYRFWVERFSALLQRFDLIRLDHFIGFARYWQIAAGAKSAKEGRWQKGPGHDLFMVAQRKLGALPFIAEDLGEVDSTVEALRDELGLPGMRVLQFAFGGDARNAFLPHNYVRHAVAYTGTHDNSTTLGWLKSGASAAELARVRSYVGRDGASPEELSWELVRLLFSSVAQLAIVPMQDVLGLGDEARMNVPGRGVGNWSYRVARADLSKQLAKRLGNLTVAYGR